MSAASLTSVVYIRSGKDPEPDIRKDKVFDVGKLALVTAYYKHAIKNATI